MAVTKQIYHPYYDWECFQAGMYSDSDSDFELVSEANEILSNPVLFEELGRKMIKTWIKSAEHNLTDCSTNRKSWVGHAACMFSRGIPYRTTVKAWGELTGLQKLEANKVADKLIKEYEEQNRRLYKDMGEKGLF